MNGLMLMISLCVFVSFTLAESTLDVDCGDPKTSTSGTLTYTGDAVAVFAYGANEPCKFEDNIDTGTRMLKISYDPAQDCAFIQDEGGAPWYTLKVESRMVHELFESGDDEKFLVDCNYMSIKTDITASIGIQEKPKEEEYQLINNGNAAVSAFAIFVVRAADDVKLTGPIIQTTIVNLQSQMTPSGEEETYVPIECLAESSDGTVKVQILAAGCGTGFPWRKNQGFTVTTTKAKSPNFRMFRIQKQDNLVFRCSFVICDGDCNGSSCERGGQRRRRRRRSLTKGLTYNSLGLIHSDSPKIRRARVAVSLNETFTLTQSVLDQLNTNSSRVPLKLSL